MRPFPKLPYFVPRISQLRRSGTTTCKQPTLEHGRENQIAMPLREINDLGISGIRSQCDLRVTSVLPRPQHPEPKLGKAFGPTDVDDFTGEHYSRILRVCRQGDKFAPWRDNRICTAESRA